MWNYEKRLQYPVNIKNPDGRIAQIIIMGVLNDIGTEESVPPGCHGLRTQVIPGFLDIRE